MEAQRVADEAAAEATAAAKATGEAKLAELGLTADEIAALVVPLPPQPPASAP